MTITVVTIIVEREAVLKRTYVYLWQIVGGVYCRKNRSEVLGPIMSTQG